MFKSKSYFIPCPTELMHLLDDAKKREIIKTLTEYETAFFEEHKRGDIDRWHPNTPRLNQCNEFKFAHDGYGFYFAGAITIKSKIKRFGDRRIPKT